jgi:hypothetical protein
MNDQGASDAMLRLLECTKCYDDCHGKCDNRNVIDI